MMYILLAFFFLLQKLFKLNFLLMIEISDINVSSIIHIVNNNDTYFIGNF